MRRAMRAQAGWTVPLAVAASLLVASCAGGTSASTVTTFAGSPTTAPTVVAVSYRGGLVVEGTSRQRAVLGQPVTVRVTSDVADQVHVHGYDKMVDVAAGRTAEVTFLANVPGMFDVELEKTKKVLFTLEVR